MIHASQLSSQARNSRAGSIRFKALPMVLGAILATAGHSQAFAQASAGGQAPTQAMQDFRVAAGALSSVLSAFSAQSGLQLIYAPEVVAEKSSVGLNARMAPEAALNELLKGTQLKARKIDDKTYAVVADGAGPARSDRASGASASQAGAQPSVTDVGRIEVTGSRLKRVEVEGVSPVAVFTQADIEQSGESSVSDFLRSTVYNSYGSTGGYLSANNATVSLRGLGNYYTTVLVDGRRATSAPTLEGAAQNISFIPSSAVERIEIMRGGASAIYGSDAIGGVINIVMKKDFTGATFAYAKDFPTNSKPGVNAVASLGVGSDRGAITISVDHMESGDMPYSDFRKYAPANARNLITPNTLSPSAVFYSPQTGNVSHPNVAQYTAGNPRMIPVNGVYMYDLAYGIGESKRKKDSVMAQGKLSLSDNIELFMSTFASESNNHTIISDAMVMANNPGPYLTIRADNPYNPFGVDGVLYHTYSAWGPRFTEVLDRSRSASLGVRGSSDWFSGADWELAAGYGRVNHHYQGRQYVIGSKLQDLLNAGLYNPFDPNHPTVAAVRSQIEHDPFRKSENTEISFDGHINFYDVFNLPGGGVQLVMGFDHRKSQFSLLHDPQTMAGNVSGLSGSANTVADRTYTAGYFEGLLPVFKQLNVTVAGRYDSYSDFNARFSPNVGLEFRPHESLLVRASWERGFRAPTLVDLHSARANLLSTISPHMGLSPVHLGGDEVAAAALAAYKAANPAGLSPAQLAAYQPYPVDPSSPTGTYQFLTGSNPSLNAETSQNMGVGIVFSPNEDLSLAIDFFDVKIDGIITVMPAALAARLGEINGGLVRAPNIIAPGGVALPGPIVNIDQSKSNGNSKHVRGLELDASWRVRTGFGDLVTNLAWSQQLKDEMTPIGLPTIDSLGALNFPKSRGQLALQWRRGAFEAAGTVKYISSNGQSSQPDYHLPSHQTYDLQFQYNAPWNARLSVGVRNITDKFPPMVLGTSWLPTFALYDVDGRTPFIRYTQNF